MQELAIIKEHDLNVKTIVINNKFMGMVKQWQDLFFDKRYASTSIPVQPDFVKLAEAYGIKGYRAETPKDTTEVLEEALNRRAVASWSGGGRRRTCLSHGPRGRGDEGHRPFQGTANRPDEGGLVPRA